MTTSASRDLFHGIQSHELAADSLAGRISELLERQVREDHLLEYKSGPFLVDGEDAEERRGVEPRKASERLRKWISGFANVDGGTLIVGVTDGRQHEHWDPWSVTGCARSETGDALKEWVQRSLADVTRRITPHPEVHVVSVRGQEVLVVSVQRAPQLIPCYLSGSEVYFVRNGDQTLALASTTYVDLTLGRRQRPTLDLGATCSYHPSGSEAYLDLRLTVTNESMVPGERLAPRLVAFATSEPNTRPLPRGLTEQLDLGGHRDRARALGAGQVLQPIQGQGEPPAFTDVAAFSNLTWLMTGLGVCGGRRGRRARSTRMRSEIFGFRGCGWI